VRVFPDSALPWRVTMLPSARIPMPDRHTYVVSPGLAELAAVGVPNGVGDLPIVHQQDEVLAPR
jgi:hypothetical protein